MISYSIIVNVQPRKITDSLKVGAVFQRMTEDGMQLSMSICIEMTLLIVSISPFFLMFGTVGKVNIL